MNEKSGFLDYKVERSLVSKHTPFLSGSCVVTVPFVSFVVKKGYIFDTNSLVGSDRELL